MADPLQIELVAADRIVWSGEARQVSARTVEGDLGILADHAPLLSVLAPGAVEITPVDGKDFTAVVEDGFISVANNRVSILSEDAFLAHEVDLGKAKSDLETAQESGDEAAIGRAQTKVSAAEKAS